MSEAIAPTEATTPVADTAAAPAAAPAVVAPTETPAAQAPAAPSTLLGSEPAKAEGEGAKPVDGETPKEEPKAEEPPAGAPDEYADFTAPEGVVLDTEVTGELKALAKELNLPQDAAQKIADLGVKLAEKNQAAFDSQMGQIRTSWKEQSQADPDIGGTNLEATLASARKGRDFVGTPALAELLETTGLGDHPEVLRMLAKVGRSISEDKIITSIGQPPAARPRTFYDHAERGAV